MTAHPHDTAPPLFSDHADLLITGSGILPEFVSERGYFSVSSPNTIRALGFNRAQAKVGRGLVLPVHPPDGGRGPYLLRPDTPRAAGRKYELPPEAGVRLDCPRRCRARLRDPRVDLWWTEGLRKVDALASHGLCAVGLLGVWGFKGRNALGGNTVLADLDYIALNGRACYLVFDNDVMRNLKVRAALERLAEHLRRKGAGVHLVYLPDSRQKIGVDDYLLTHTVAELRALADQEPAAAPTSAPAEGWIPRLAAAIRLETAFAQDVGGRLHVYERGSYRAHGEAYIKAAVKRLLGEYGESSRWRTRLAGEVVEYLRVDAPLLWERPPRDVLNVQNGLLDVATGTLAPHSPAHLSAVQVPVRYDPAATCPAWDAAIAAWVPAEDAGTLEEILGDVLSPDMGIKKAILLLGEGDNGKSTFLRGLAAFVGKGNTVGVSLQKLESDRFATARLLGKLANVCPDLPSAHLEGTSVFKAITGGDALNAEFKNRDAFDFAPCCRLLFSANRPPESADATAAFFNRWTVMTWLRVFEGATAKPSALFDAELADPQELSGLLNRVLAGLRRLRQQHTFSESAAMRTAHAEFRAATDPFAVWLEQRTVEDPDGVLPQGALIGAYAAYSREHGIAAVTTTAFGLMLGKLRPRVERKQRTVAGRANVWCYVGLAWRPPPAAASPPGRDNGDNGLNGVPLYFDETESNNNKGGIGANPVEPVEPVEPDAPDDDVPLGGIYRHYPCPVCGNLIPVDADRCAHCAGVVG